jgi:hypothetical protein
MSRAEIPDASGSALDLRPALLDPASTLLYGDNMRRRGSDISRLRPSVIAEEIELSPLPRDIEEQDTASVLTKRDAVESESTAGDAEALTVSAAPSLSLADETSSAVPFASPLDRKRQRRKSLLCFFALCWCFFLAGWNDGSTGPLLPTIQRYYDVRHSALHCFMVCI